MTKFGADELEQVFSRVLASVARVLDAQGQPWMLLGGLAVGAWTDVSGSKDLNFAVELPADFASVEAALRSEGFTAARGSFGDLAKEGGTVRLTTTSGAGAPVFADLLCAGTDFEREALSRRRALQVLGVPLHVASPDDLAVYKLIAGRPQDLADIDTLIRFKRVPEDEAYLRRWAREWGVEDRWDAALRTAQQ